MHTYIILFQKEHLTSRDRSVGVSIPTIIIPKNNKV